ncbi:hypothetical protein [Herbiconiux ginsengi]|uniref:Uncharacterized protein n=1 Tax=Herbiconiux ginsengi TaxID=381665 RepID=A0A1H3U2J3_9MICO|nr:hypothetical protein [Herbiconiux ginsengi]SDZ56281.1 hypothetical protein SAMN05216554_0012 [Herbiconiux ginsengi]
MSTNPASATTPNKSARGVVLLTSLVGSALVLSGCASLAPDGAAAQRVTETFLTAIADGDGATACQQLNDSARETVENETDAGCAEGVLALNIETEAPASSGEVYSRAAFVETGETAVFLTPGDDGWLIRAAGCTPMAEGPFDCLLDGR